MKSALKGRVVSRSKTAPAIMGSKCAARPQTGALTRELMIDPAISMLPAGFIDFGCPASRGSCLKIHQTISSWDAASRVVIPEEIVREPWDATENSGRASAPLAYNKSGFPDVSLSAALAAFNPLETTGSNKTIGRARPSGAALVIRLAPGLSGFAVVVSRNGQTFTCSRSRFFRAKGILLSAEASGNVRPHATTATDH